ncbi:MAG TPA: lanthionine synthetase C family protein [Bacteroidia bacterium]|jgi:lantibiotic modifying enzyme|nr:lanthionine synthetase C family protein [Bacteroidia bacterium]
MLLQELRAKTKQIVDAVIREDFKNKNGLLSGTSGTLFLLCYYNEYAKDQRCLEIVEKRISDTMDAINDDPEFSDLSYSSGLTGFLWTLENLNAHQYIELDLNEFKEAVHPILNDYMMRQLEEGNIDFLHGALGVANYFLDSGDTRSIEWLKAFNKQLLTKAILNDDDTISFMTNIYRENKAVPVVNLGLSHGMASIIYYLQRCLKLEQLNSPELKRALQQLLLFYKRNQNDITVHPSYFASWVGPEKSSRLAWCYGDLGIGLTFLLAAETLNDQELKNYSIEILKHTCKRMNLSKEGIKDAGLCHGTTGLVKIYRNLYQKTTIPEFKTAGDFWLQKTIEIATHESGHAGYKTFSIDHYENDCGLLEGISGVGIVFLEELMRKPLSWEKSLMLA